MSCTLSLGPNNDLELSTPSGRRVYIPIGPHSTQLLWQVLWNATAERRSRARGLVADFPTQATMNAWAEALGEERRGELRAKQAQSLIDRFGFDIAELDIDL